MVRWAVPRGRIKGSWTAARDVAHVLENRNENDRNRAQSNTTFDGS